MNREFFHRSIRATIRSSSVTEFTWSVFPTAKLEITDVVTSDEPARAAKLAVAEACEEIDAWVAGLAKNAASR